MRFRSPYIEAGPTVFLDASAEPLLIQKGFNMVSGTNLQLEGPTAELPDSVEVYQHSETDYGKGTVGLSPHDKGPDSRLKQYAEVVQELSRYPPETRIGLVTFKDIESELAIYLNDQGFLNVTTAHYGLVRSVNTMKDVEVLILFGTARPDFNELALNAQAFFFDEDPIDPTYDFRHIERVDTTYGYSVRMKSAGYSKDERIQAMHKQASTWEMYQAFHRARPLLRDKETPLKVFVYSALPIPGVKVTSFLGRYSEIAEILRIELERDGEIKSSKLAHLTLKQGANIDSEQKFIRRGSVPIRIAELAGAQWDATTRKFKS